MRWEANRYMRGISGEGTVKGTTRSKGAGILKRGTHYQLPGQADGQGGRYEDKGQVLPGILKKKSVTGTIW